MGPSLAKTLDPPGDRAAQETPDPLSDTAKEFGLEAVSELCKRRTLERTSSNTPRSCPVLDTALEGPATPESEASDEPASPIEDLLKSYRALFEATTDPVVRRLRYQRLAIGVGFGSLIEHVRGVLDLLDRRYRLETSISTGQNAEEVNHDAQRVREFAASLPRPPSRLQQVWPFLAALVITQLLLASPIPGWLLSIYNASFTPDERHWDGGSSRLQSLTPLARGTSSICCFKRTYS